MLLPEMLNSPIGYIGAMPWKYAGGKFDQVDAKVCPHILGPKVSETTKCLITAKDGTSVSIT